MSPSNVLDHVVAYWIACSKHINLLQKKNIGWPKIGIGWEIKNYGVSKWIGSTTCWTSCGVFATIATSSLGFAIGTTISTDLIGSIWMLSIT